VFGDGTATRDYLNIDDLVQPNILVLHHPELSGKAINFASGINTSIKDIAEYIAKRSEQYRAWSSASWRGLGFPADIRLRRALASAASRIWKGIDRYIECFENQ